MSEVFLANYFEELDFLTVDDYLLLIIRKGLSRLIFVRDALIFVAISLGRMTEACNWQTMPRCQIGF